MVLKRKLARRSWPIEAVVEAVWPSHGSDSLGRHRGFPIGLKYVWIWLQSGLKKTTFSATIGPRSWVNHDPKSPSIACRSRGDESPTIPRRNLLDRGSIAPRSRIDRAEIVEFFHDVLPPSDEASGEWTVRSRSSGIPF